MELAQLGKSIKGLTMTFRTFNPNQCPYQGSKAHPPSETPWVKPTHTLPLKAVGSQNMK